MPRFSLVRVTPSLVALLALAAGGTLPACSSTGDTPTTSDAGAAIPDASGSTIDATADATAADAGPEALDAMLPDGGAPSLLSLSVSPLALTPTFSPDVHDYYVQCAAGTNALTITMTASPGAHVGIAQPAASASTDQPTVSLGVVENAAVVATASQGASTASYWIRCLPHDFPTLSMTTFTDAGAPTAGYYLLGNAVITGKGEAGYAMALDGNGVPVWYRAVPSSLGSFYGMANVDSLATNTISYVPLVPYTFGTTSGSYEVHALAAATSQKVTPNGEPLDEHELRLLPNGNYVVFTWPVVTGVDMTGLSNYGASENVVDCRIQEISPAGQTVWQWSAMDHLDPVKDCTFPATEVVTGTPPSSGLDASADGATQDAAAADASALDAGSDAGPPTAVDPFHCNSIDVAANGDLLVSARHMDSIFLVSKATGKIAWKMGGSTYTKDGATFLAVSGDPMNGFYRQHDARFQPDGTISLFDDETGKAGPARGLVLSYDVTKGSASIAWQYQGTQSSVAMGSFRVLPDGSRLIDWGLVLAASPAFTEVGLDGGVQREMTFPHGDCSYRAVKVPLSALDLGVMRSTAGGTD